MNRRAFIGKVTGGLCALPFAVHAQTVAKSYRIGWLREGVLPIGPAFWNAARDLGWIEGKNLTVESRFATSADQLPALASELAKLDVDLILTDGTPSTRAAKAATPTIPIVFSIGADPVAQGFVASLAKPGGNLTGFTFGSYDDKQLQVLTQALPGKRRIAYPVEATGSSVQRAAAALGLHVDAIPVRGVDDLAAFFKAARSRRIEAVVFPNASWTGPHEARIAGEAIKAGMPLLGTWRSFAVSGALLSYGPKPGHWLSVATQVDKILRGAKPADVPVESPSKFDLVVNRTTAKLLRVEIPQSFLVRADELIG